MPQPRSADKTTLLQKPRAARFSRRSRFCLQTDSDVHTPIDLGRGYPAQCPSWVMSRPRHPRHVAPAAQAMHIFAESLRVTNGRAPPRLCRMIVGLRKWVAPAVGSGISERHPQYAPHSVSEHHPRQASPSPAASPSSSVYQRVAADRSLAHRFMVLTPRSMMTPFPARDRVWRRYPLRKHSSPRREPWTLDSVGYWARSACARRFPAAT